MVLGSSPVAVTSPSDFAPALSKEFLDIQATVECRFTLKHVRDMTRTYSHVFNLETRGFSLLTCEFELVTREFEPATRRFKVSTRVLLFHSSQCELFLQNGVNQI